jgi:hypothetical protein
MFLLYDCRFAMALPYAKRKALSAVLSADTRLCFRLFAAMARGAMRQIRRKLPET